MGWDPEALRQQINRYPPYVGARIEVTHITEDGGEIRVRMPLEDGNTNLVGTHFGGSLYAMVDPHLMILLVHSVGESCDLRGRSSPFVFSSRSTPSASRCLPRCRHGRTPRASSRVR